MESKKNKTISKLSSKKDKVTSLLNEATNLDDKVAILRHLSKESKGKEIAKGFSKLMKKI
tara:strand:- start:405 stop:584 length:180 start_codon:yes stop_codon:yes gene_type:complete